jgi:uncharacterized protein (DUF697 family)
MESRTLLQLYEKLEALVAKLPGPLQKAVLDELRPIKQIFLAQRLANIVLLGEPHVDASAILSALIGTELRTLEPQVATGWVTYAQRGRGAFRLLDARRLADASLGWSNLESVLAADRPDLFLFLAAGSGEGGLTLECEQSVRVIELGERESTQKAGVVGVVDLPAGASEAERETKRLALQALLKDHPKIAPRLGPVVSVSSFVRFRADGSIDPERDERRDIALLADVIARELPEDAQVEMARLISARDTQSQIAHRLVRSITAVCAAIGAQPIPLADFPILTALQFAMVSGIMNVSGRTVDIRSATEFFGALGLNIGAGMILREGARAAVKLLPGWGSAISGGVAAAGTYAVGRSAIAYFIEGYSLDRARGLFRRKKARGKELGV